MALPSRPRLAEHVFARRYRSDADERVVLYDRRTGGVAEIGLREWVVVSCADGTRDLEGVLLAAESEGAATTLDAARAFFQHLDEDGLLADGPARVSRGPAATAAGEAETPEVEPIDPDRPIEPLPGYALTCDGRGSCCRIYVSVIFGPTEAALARGLLPLVHDGGARHERVFVPERGSVAAGGAAVTLCEGRCAYLGGDGRCALHVVGGAMAKPIGCNTFPAVFVDDGERVRASVSVECACVIASIGRDGGAPLVPASVHVRGDLDPMVRVVRLPLEVPITPETTVSRAAFVAWSRRLASAPPGENVAAFMWRLSAAIASGGLGEAAIDEASTSADVPREAEVVPWIEALERRAGHMARRDEVWRSPKDLALRAARWIATACAALREPGAAEAVLGAVPAPETEAFYLRAIAHGHRLVDGLPLTRALADRAVRLLVARALTLIFTAEDPSVLDPSCSEPLALVEAMLRGHGLDAYAHDLDLPRRAATAG